MGADQIGWLVRVDTTKLKALTEDDVRAWFEKNSVNGVVFGNETWPEGVIRISSQDEEDEDSVPVFDVGFVLRTFGDVQRLVFEGARDTMRRADWDEPDKVVLYSGEMSWGERPDGFGYGTLEKASDAGLLELFGIEA